MASTAAVYKQHSSMFKRSRVRACWSSRRLASLPSAQYNGTPSELMACSGMRSCRASTASGLPSMPVRMLPPRSATAAWPPPCSIKITGDVEGLSLWSASAPTAAGLVPLRF